MKTEIERLNSTTSSLSGEITDIDTELTRIKKRGAIISSSVANYSTRIQSIGDDKIDMELSELTGKKGKILRKIENHEIENREIITLITSLKNGSRCLN